MSDTNEKTTTSEKPAKEELVRLAQFLYNNLKSHLVTDIVQVLDVMMAVDIDNGVLMTVAGDDQASQKLEPGHYLIVRVAHLPNDDHVYGLCAFPLVGQSHANG